MNIYWSCFEIVSRPFIILPVVRFLLKELGEKKGREGKGGSKNKWD